MGLHPTDGHTSERTQDPTREFPYWRATAVYVLALSLVAAGVIAGYVLVAGLNERTGDDAALVNAAGRQRMLAQRIARLDVGLRLGLTPDQRAAKTRILREAFETWRRGHANIVREETSLRMAPHELSSNVVKMASLQTQYLAIDIATRDVLDSAEARRELPPSTLGPSCDAYVAEMDGLLLTFERESQAQVRKIAVSLKVIVVGAVLLLAAEGLFVFRPLIHGLRESYRGLREAHRDAQRELERRLEAERERDELKGLLPICSGCKKIRDDDGDWRPLEQYIEERSEARFSHGLCNDCVRRLYPEHAEAVLAMVMKEKNGTG